MRIYIKIISTLIILLFGIFSFKSIAINEIEQIEETDEENKIIKGTYIIKSCIDEQKVLNVDIKNGNVNLWTYINNISEQFEIEYLEQEECYTIKSVLTGKYLDVYGGYKSRGTNVQVWKGNNTAGQKWEIKKEINGYSIISKCNGLNLDIYGGYGTNGTNAQVWENNGTKGQRFKIEKVTDDEEILQNGTYKIKLYSNPNKSLDVNSDNSNVSLWDSRNTANQQFEIEYIEKEKCYTIKSNITGKYLDVYGGFVVAGTNVQMWKGNGTEGQKWIIQKYGDKYLIISKCNGLYLDIYGGYTSNGTNAQLWNFNGGQAQQFSIQKYENPDKPAITEGIYKIHLAADFNKVVEVKDGSIKSGANIQVGYTSNVKNQYFEIKYENGNYRLRALNSNKMLDVYGGFATEGTNVEQFWENSSNAQKWYIQKEGEHYSIISRCGNLYLDVYGGFTQPGTNIQIWKDNGTIGQRFDLEEISEDIPVVSEGNYRIRTAVSKNMALDVYADSKANGANIQIYNNSNVLNQRFKLVYLGKDIYRIENLSSKKVLEVQGGKNAPETNVCQNDWKDIDAQKWKIIDAGDGFYYVVSLCNGLYLDVYRGNSSNETNVQVYPGHGGISQKFAFDSVIFGIDISYYQGDIDFNQVNASGKADFIIARAGYGKNASQKDAKFEEYYAESKRLGIPVGSYLYSYASGIDGAYAEAYNVLEWLKGKSFELPIFYDLEDKMQDGLDPDTIAEMARAFGETLKEHGYKVGVYASKNWFKYRINVEKIPEDYSIWVAAYGSASTGNNGFVPAEVYEYFGEHDIWQYSSRGFVEGISGYVDVNIAYKNHLR